jgi:cysteine-rich repeat protein
MLQMKSNGGGWGLVYQIAGQSDMMTYKAHQPGLLVGQEAGPSTGHSAKLADATIRRLCGDQYNVRQFKSTVKIGKQSVVPHSLFCRFADVNRYADNTSYVDKYCSLKYDPTASSYKKPKLSAVWSRGFSTWGGITGATITQLHYKDGRRGSHICAGCSAKQKGCGSGGGCHTQVFCKSIGGSLCGNGRRDADEACDDGNHLSDDGCSNECTLEKGFTCTTRNKQPDLCEDHDECRSGNVCGKDPQAKCINLPGSFVCECNTGTIDSHIASGLCPPIDGEAKLSDEQINAIGGGKKLFKLISKQRGAMYYMRSGQEFDDTKSAMNLLPVSFSKDGQSWKASCRGRIDTECSFGNNCQRIFTDYGKRGRHYGCYPHSGKRCFSDGVHCGHKPIIDFEMWIKPESGQSGQGTCAFIKKDGM